jgi:hypothetical protein
MSDFENNFQVGDEVLYIPLHAQGKADHKDCEHGVVTSLSRNGDTIFVRYGKEEISKATYAWNLKLIRRP